MQKQKAISLQIAFCFLLCGSQFFFIYYLNSFILITLSNCHHRFDMTFDVHYESSAFLLDRLKFLAGV